jgi:hypothetical protein
MVMELFYSLVEGYYSVYRGRSTNRVAAAAEEWAVICDGDGAVIASLVEGYLNTADVGCII